MYGKYKIYWRKNHRRKNGIYERSRILENTGRETAIFLTAPGMPDLAIVTDADFSGQPGQVAYIRLRPEKIHIFNAKSHAITHEK